MADVEITGVVDMSEQLDLLVIEYFQTLAEIFTCRQQLENDMRDGFFYMAKVTGHFVITF